MSSADDFAILADLRRLYHHMRSGGTWSPHDAERLSRGIAAIERALLAKGHMDGDRVIVELDNDVLAALKMTADDALFGHLRDDGRLEIGVERIAKFQDSDEDITRR